MLPCLLFSFFFFFNDTATTEIYTLSLHDALPISSAPAGRSPAARASPGPRPRCNPRLSRSEEHTSELQSRLHLVCRLLLEKKKKKTVKHPDSVNEIGDHLGECDNKLTLNSSRRTQ